MQREIYNAKLHIYSRRAEPIFLGMICNEGLAAFDAAGVEVLTRESSWMIRTSAGADALGCYQGYLPLP